MATEIFWGTKARHLGMRQSAADISTECGEIDFTDGALCRNGSTAAKDPSMDAGSGPGHKAVIQAA